MRWWFILFLLILSACSPASNTQPSPNLTLTAVFDAALLQATQTFPTATPSPSPSPTPAPTATPVRTPPALPSGFRTNLVAYRDQPRAYIADLCQALRMKWDPQNSAPGTVVMPIMFHRISGEPGNEPYTISSAAVTRLLEDLHEQGFESITMQQLAGFLQRNEKIPSRSVLLIADDRHYAGYYRDNFYPLLSKYDWTMTNAWIAHPESNALLVQENVQLQNEGWVDHQAHGVVHNINITEYPANTVLNTELYGSVSVEEFIHKELAGSMDGIRATFGKAPIAYIWPGGGFSRRGVEVAREVGFQLGFTVNPRGPLMFNWIPQADEVDPGRPAFSPEGTLNDPLMLLPRYWDVDAGTHIDTVRQIGEEAAAYAEQVRPVEMEYYDIVCAPRLGPLTQP